MRSVAARTVLGFCQLLVALGVALFGPAWTFDYWQAWVYLVVFGGSAGLISLYLWRRDPRLLQRRLNAGPAAEQRAGQRIIQTLAALLFIALFVVCSLDRRSGWSDVPRSVSIAANVVVALGFLIVYLV